MADKVFLKCKAKERTFNNGGSVINISIKVDDLIRFANEHKNERGYLNLTVQARREVGQYGDTHSVTLDTYQSGARQTAPADDAEDW